MQPPALTEVQNEHDTGPGLSGCWPPLSALFAGSRRSTTSPASKIALKKQASSPDYKLAASRKLLSSLPAPEPVHRMRHTGKRAESNSDTFSRSQLLTALSGAALAYTASPPTSPVQTSSHALTMTRQRLQEQIRQQRVDAAMEEEMQAAITMATMQRTSARAAEGAGLSSTLMRKTTPVLGVDELQLGSIVCSCAHRHILHLACVRTSCSHACCLVLVYVARLASMRSSPLHVGAGCAVRVAVTLQATQVSARRAKAPVRTRRGDDPSHGSAATLCAPLQEHAERCGALEPTTDRCCHEERQETTRPFAGAWTMLPQPLGEAVAGAPFGASEESRIWTPAEQRLLDGSTSGASAYSLPGRCSDSSDPGLPVPWGLHHHVVSAAAFAKRRFFAPPMAAPAAAAQYLADDTFGPQLPGVSTSGRASLGPTHASAVSAAPPKGSSCSGSSGQVTAPAQSDAPGAEPTWTVNSTFLQQRLLQDPQHTMVPVADVDAMHVEASLIAAGASLDTEIAGMPSDVSVLLA